MSIHDDIVQRKASGAHEITLSLDALEELVGELKRARLNAQAQAEKNCKLQDDVASIVSSHRSDWSWDDALSDVRALKEQAARPAVRDDVFAFAMKMSAAMDSKHIERESRNDPHYMSDEYLLTSALACAADKVDQLEHWAIRADGDRTEPKKRERAIKTAVHLANFCMIVAAKLDAQRGESDK